MSPKFDSEMEYHTAAIHRISPLHKIQVLESQYETLFQSVCKLAITLCNVPVAVVAFCSDHTIWIKAEVGEPIVSKVPRNDAFCDWAVSNGHYLEIPDTTLDKQGSVLVTNFPNYKYYAGAPLKLPLGEVIGTLCVFDTKPNRLDAHQKTVLIGLCDVLTKALVIKESYLHQIEYSDQLENDMNSM